MARQSCGDVYDCQVISQPALTSHTPSTAEGDTR